MFEQILTYLFPTVLATFQSNYPLEESIERLRAASVTSIFRAGFSQAAVGDVSKEGVTLARFIPFVGNNARPYFTGTFQQGTGGVVLCGRFTASKWSKVSVVSWLGFVSLWTLVVTLATLSPRATVWWGSFVGMAMIVLGVGILRLNQWFARNDVTWLSHVIEQAISSSDKSPTRQPRRASYLKKKFLDLAGQ